MAEADRSLPGFVRLRLDVAGGSRHRPGQHVVLRLRAADGYTAQRSYSIASDPDDPQLELMVECLPGGEVSGFLHDEVRVGDLLELRGPIGGHFVWEGAPTAVAVAGGSGVVPILSMVRYARGCGLSSELRVVVTARSLGTLPYAEELLASGAFVALTRENHGDRVAAPPYPDEVAPLVRGLQVGYVCGSVGFAGFAARLLQEAGMAAESILVEQFGATG